MEKKCLIWASFQKLHKNTENKQKKMLKHIWSNKAIGSINREIMSLENNSPVIAFLIPWMSDRHSVGRSPENGIYNDNR